MASAEHMNTTSDKSFETQNPEKCSVSILNEYAMRNRLTVKYDLVSRAGPCHQLVFTFRVILGDRTYPDAKGNSVKKAKKAAAAIALQHIDAIPPPETTNQENNDDVSHVREAKMDTYQVVNQKLQSELDLERNSNERLEKINTALRNENESLRKRVNTMNRLIILEHNSSAITNLKMLGENRTTITPNYVQHLPQLVVQKACAKTITSGQYGRQNSLLVEQNRTEFDDTPPVQYDEARSDYAASIYQDVENPLLGDSNVNKRELPEASLPEKTGSTSIQDNNLASSEIHPDDKDSTIAQPFDEFSISREPPRSPHIQDENQTQAHTKNKVPSAIQADDKLNVDNQAQSNVPLTIQTSFQHSKPNIQSKGEPPANTQVTGKPRPDIQCERKSLTGTHINGRVSKIKCVLPSDIQSKGETPANTKTNSKLPSDIQSNVKPTINTQCNGNISPETHTNVERPSSLNVNRKLTANVRANVKGKRIAFSVSLVIKSKEDGKEVSVVGQSVGNMHPFECLDKLCDEVDKVSKKYPDLKLLLYDYENFNSLFSRIEEDKTFPTAVLFIFFHSYKEKENAKLKKSRAFNSLRSEGFAMEQITGDSGDAADTSLVLAIGRLHERVSENIPFLILGGDRFFGEVDRDMSYTRRKVFCVNLHNTKIKENIYDCIKCFVNGEYIKLKSEYLTYQ